MLNKAARCACTRPKAISAAISPKPAAIASAETIDTLASPPTRWLPQ
jgi:hypothetical protein